MTRPVCADSAGMVTAEGLLSVAGHTPWESDQQGPEDVRRAQVLPRIHPGYGKLVLADRLAFAAASLALSCYDTPLEERTGICIALPFGSLSTDRRFTESITAGYPSPAFFSATLPSSTVSDIAIIHKLKGPNRVFAHGGPSGLFALEAAIHSIESGKADAMLVLWVTALEHEERENPHIPPLWRDMPNEACAVVLRAAPGPKRNLSCALTLSDSAGSISKHTGTDYFRYFTEAVACGKKQSIEVRSGNCRGRIELTRG